MQTHLRPTRLSLKQFGLFLCLASGFATQALADPSADAHAPIWLAIGEQRPLHYTGLSRYSLGSPDPIRVLAPRKGESETLWIKAVKPGRTDLVVFFLDGHAQTQPIVTYLPREKSNPSVLETSISELNEFEVRLSQTGYWVGGEIRNEAQAWKLDRFARRFPGQIELHGRLDDDLRIRLRARLDHALQSRKLERQISVTPQPGGFELNGFVESPQILRQIRRNLEAEFPLLDLKLESSNDGHPTLYFRVYVLEFKRTDFLEYGLNLNLAPTGFQVTTPDLDTALNLQGVLKAGATQGGIKILSQPELVVKTPGQAELFSGGEIPIRNQNKFVSNIGWRPYGLELKLNALSFQGNSVRLEIAAEMSQLDPGAISDEKVPGLKASRMKTSVEAQLGRPLLLSGLVQDIHRDLTQGPPLLKDIPLIGSFFMGLFGSTEKTEDRVELLVVLIPHLTPPAPDLRAFGIRFAKGPNPAPRNRLSREEIAAILESPRYPWSAFE